ncbi:MAG: 4Fe-4S binding protein [Candidatus Aminicenantes bacterium]|nr:4Fe-4S binding protein [Candidatus Aminicenantes bacterium]
MKRKIIHIDQELCNGCGLCLPNCPEGALQLIDGKARLVSDLFCDGLGACIGTCPLGAIHVEEREAEPYDERRVMENIAAQGTNVIRAHLEHLAAHGETAYLEQARQFLRAKGIPEPQAAPAPSAEPRTCPGARVHDRRQEETSLRTEASGAAPEAGPSELRTWPVQLHLLNPQASFFEDAELLVAADCVPFAYPAFHEEFVRGRIPVIFCPKLDHASEAYVEKLAAILRLHDVRTLHVAHMEVPCCSGTTALVRQALARSGKTVPIVDHTISIQGRLLDTKHPRPESRRNACPE